MKKLKDHVVAAIRVGESDAGRIVGKSLKALREIAGLTQEQMAVRLSVKQAAISKIEHRGDVQISSLQRYVSALGATLRIDASFPSDAELARRLQPSDESDITDENQLVFPIFGDELLRPGRDEVLSIHPRYSEKIMQGEKTVELRRRFPVSSPRGSMAYIYSTSPVRAIVGKVEIAEVVKLPVDQIWTLYSELAAIERSEFQSYFLGLSEGVAVKFKNVQPLPRSLPLAELRSRFGFEPPQSFLYANSDLRKAIQDEYTNVSH